MTVEEIERRFYELKGKLDVGAITEAEFRAEIGKLRFQDAENRWWMIGAQSGKWYTYDGARWIPRQPPRGVAVTPPPPEPTRATPGEAAESVTLAIRRSDLARQLAETAAQPRPALPSFRRRARPAPIPVFAIIGCAAVAVMVLVLAVWIAVDNLVPGKPISSLMSGSTRGGTPTALSKGTPTAAPGAAPGGDIAALLAAGDQLVLQSQMETAMAQYQSAASLAPTSPAPLTRWSRALAFKGQLQDAVAKARQAVQRGPNDADAHAQLSRALAWSGQTNEAIAAGEKALQLDPQNANARASLTEAYLWARRSADAQAQAQAALQLAPQSAEAHRAQAWVLTLAWQKDAALTEWQQTVALEPNLFFRHFELGEVLRVFFRMPTEAAAAYRQSLSLYGAYIPAISRLGLAYLDLNQPQNAIAQFQRAITLDPNNVDGYAYLGIAFARTNQCPQAIPYFEYALRIDANHSIARRGLDDCKDRKTPGVPAPPAPNVPLAPPTLVPSSSALPAPTPSARIIFTVYDASAKRFALFSASAADGRGRTKISEDASSASVRSDGALLLFTNWAPNQRGIWTMGLDGERRQLTARGEHHLASFSPDGSAFVFAARAGTGDSQILRGDAAQMNPDDALRVLSNGQAPTWGPTDRIAYKPCARGGCGIALMNPDGSGTKMLANFADTTVPAWSPDGSKIAVGARTKGAAWNIFLVDVANGLVLQLTNQPATDGPAAFSPDGKSIAFLSSRDNTWAIWVMNRDGSDLRKAFDLGGVPAGQSDQMWWEQRVEWVR